MFEQPVFGELGVVSVDRDGEATDFRGLGMERFQLVLSQDITALLRVHSRMIQNLVYSVCAVRLRLPHVVSIVCTGTNLRPSSQRQH